MGCTFAGVQKIKPNARQPKKAVGLYIPVSQNLPCTLCKNQGDEAPTPLSILQTQPVVFSTTVQRAAVPPADFV